MSALGQKRTFAVQNGMSALPPKADMCGATSRCPLCANSGHRVAYVFDIEVFANGQRRVVYQFDCDGERQPCGCGPSYPSVMAISQTDLPCRSVIAEAYSGDW